MKMAEINKKEDMIYISNILEEKSDEIYNKLNSYQETAFPPIRYTHNIIDRYINNSLITPGINIKSKIIMRNLKYLEKMLKNRNIVIKKRENNDIYKEKNIIRFFISFNSNIWIMLVKYEKEKDKNNKIIKDLGHLLQNISVIIGISFLSGIINDESFESIIDIMLAFSLKIIRETKNEQIKDLKYMMFFYETINLIKMVFNHLEDYTQKKKDIMKNIINLINNKIIGSEEKRSINHPNKHFLSRTDYRTTILINLSQIIIKMKSTDITNMFIDLLTNIYAFQFRYVNCMRPTLKLFEPLLLNVKNKKLE